ncbi:arginine/serine-rich protein 1-like [Mizuhopecten yessoensis]|uniref:arginine/serine-rich protein 1-like n=1 Tax=Mizuhopecten yessoensis TaxID=6573 RepID=UPI000B45F155|nr:arginine/serine-rich protein 1-like [Mizuhopecten yessoensis]XP_021372909.1 arginine/serine-rich protein 1-like [Mizuhopecten yessoensis]
MSQKSSGTPPVTQSKKSTSQPLVTQITSISSRPQLAMLEQSSGRPSVTQSKKSTSQPLVTQTTSVSSRPQLAMSQQSSGRPPVTQSKKSTPQPLVTKPSKTNNSRSQQSISPQRSSRSRSRRSSQSRSRRSSQSRSPRSSRSRSRSRQSARCWSERWSSSRSQRLSRSRFSSQLRTPSIFAANETPTRKEAFPMTEARFQRRVLFVLADMRQQLSTLSRDHLAPAQGDTGEVLPEKVENLQELGEIEEILKNPENRRLVIERLCSVGGLNLKDNVRKIMDRFMTNDVMAGFNMKGNKGKMSFQKTAVFKVVQASVIKTFGTATEHEVDGAIGSCLKYAPDRRGGGGRKK